MTCPKCHYSTKVYDSRYKHDTVCRRRECLKCGLRFETREIPLELYNEAMLLHKEGTPHV